MAPRTPIPLITVDHTKPAWEQETPLHNRWHPDIPAVAEVKEGDLFRVECLDWTGGQIKDDDSAEDVKKVDLSQVHYLSGPIRVCGADGTPAQPGDLLCVEMCNLGPLPGDEWGFTGTFDRDNGAIEMSGFLELKCEVLRGGTEQYLTPMGPSKLNVNPLFEISPLEPRFSEWLVFEGISVDETGRQHYLDATVAYKRAVLNCIDYLSKFGWTKQQVYLLLSCCPCEGRISGIVDVPNAVATLAIPIAIFDIDVRPKKGGPPTGPRLMTRGDVAKCTYDGQGVTFRNPCGCGH
ncbi:formamidase isoform A [Micractinium conductrix]|nr:formamidase isoform A [Micractinium conductrix]|eukprot:PSC69699.1 formamidase isoform A [Micractinium conductrix]